MPAGGAMTTALPTYAAAPAADGGSAPRDGQQRWFRLRARPAALPLVLLLLALATLFLLGHDRAYFYRTGWHDWNSSQTLAFAENLSFRHNLLIFPYHSSGADGNLIYGQPYNRFPPGGYALIKLAILPFGDTDFRAKIYAGRLLLLLMFSAAAVLAYHSLARLTGSRWDALAATLLAFSSFYALYYADKISNEVTMELFAVMLAFHGMVVFVQEGRFRQLVIKSGLALLLGWHVYAFLLPFIVFGMTAELLKTRYNVDGRPALTGRLAGYWRTVRRSRYLTLGIVTLLFGIAVLAFNFGNEYFALYGSVPLRELPSVKSAVQRFGGNADFNAGLANEVKPEVFWPSQFYRIAVMTLPYAVNPYPRKGRLSQYQFRDYPAIALGVLAVGFCLVGLAWVGVRRRPGLLLLLATLAFSGFCWAAPLRNNVAPHDFESVFYIGIPLAAFTLALLGLRRLYRGRMTPYFAVAALVVFVLSVAAMAGVGETRAEIAVEDTEIAEYAALRELADDRHAIYAPYGFAGFRYGGAHWASEYFLAGKIVNYEYDPGPPRKPKQPGDYLMLPTREDSPALLTPEHRHIFLYDWALYDQWRRTANLGRPIIAADWQVYLRDGHFTYQSSECAHRDALFFLHIVPQSAVDLPAARTESGYDNRDFHFRAGGLTLTDGACVIERPLPGYDIAAIRTGQYTDAGPIWQGEYVLPSP